MLDAATGDLVGTIARGGPSSVDTSAHLEALQPGRLYVQVHSHPSDRTFSLFDVRVLCDAPSVRTTIVVAGRHWWYVMSVRAGDFPAPFRDVYEEYARTRVGLQPKYERLLAAGDLTEDEAIAALDREVWRTIVGRLRLTYHEIEMEDR